MIELGIVGWTALLSAVLVGGFFGRCIRDEDVSFFSLPVFIATGLFAACAFGGIAHLCVHGWSGGAATLVAIGCLPVAAWAFCEFSGPPFS